jgi:hypothetical protein
MTYLEFENTIEHLQELNLLDLKRQDHAIFLHQGIKLLEDYLKINEGEIPFVVDEPDENSSLNHGMLIYDLERRLDENGNPVPGLPQNFIELTDSKRMIWRLDAAKRFKDTTLKIYQDNQEIPFDIEDSTLLEKILESDYGLDMVSKETKISHPDFKTFLDFTLNRDLACLGVGDKLIEVGANIHSKGTSVRKLRKMGLKRSSNVGLFTNQESYGGDAVLDMDDVVNKILGYSGGTRTIAGVHAALQADSLSSVIMSKATVKSKDKYSDVFSSPGVGSTYLLRGKIGLGDVDERGKLVKPALEPVIYKMDLSFSDVGKANFLRKENSDLETALSQRKTLRLALNLNVFAWDYQYNSRGNYDLNKSSMKKTYGTTFNLSNSAAQEVVAKFNPFEYFQKTNS